MGQSNVQAILDPFLGFEGEVGSHGMTKSCKCSAMACLPRAVEVIKIMVFYLVCGGIHIDLFCNPIVLAIHFMNMPT